MILNFVPNLKAAQKDSTWFFVDQRQLLKSFGWVFVCLSRSLVSHSRNLHCDSYMFIRFFIYYRGILSSLPVEGHSKLIQLRSDLGLEKSKVFDSLSDNDFVVFAVDQVNCYTLISVVSYSFVMGDSDLENKIRNLFPNEENRLTPWVFFFQQDLRT